MELLVDVDDIVLAHNDSKLCVDFKVYLDNCFDIKDLGRLKYLFAIEVVRNSQGPFLCQYKYVLEIIDECAPLGSKPVDFSIEKNHELALALGKPLSNPT